jgi:hypothetical protein
MKTKRSAKLKLICAPLLAALMLWSDTQPLIAQFVPQKGERPAIPAIPFMSTASATSPIAAKINWIDKDGAVGYDVLRNGAVIAELGSATFNYTDSTLRPNTTYTYQVRTRRTGAPGPVTPQAIMPPGAVPIAVKPDASPAAARVTAPVQITTPRALPPVPVTAKTLSAAAAQISWSPRAETLNYVITRTKLTPALQNVGQPIRVTATPTSGIYTDQNLPEGTYTYTVQSLMRAGGAEVLGEPSKPVTLLVRPFNIVAIGDSIMWGQGLAENSKFVTKVQQWLQSQLGNLPKQVRLRNFARSGALVKLNAPSVEMQYAGELHTISAEIPRDTPSVMYQALYLAPGPGIDPFDVDLVLVDGCANDVDLTNYVLNPTVSEADLGARIQEKCGGTDLVGSMVHNLGEIHGRFPNAKILLTGYYPIISQGPVLTAVAVFLQHLGTLTGATGGAAGSIASLFGIPIDPVTGVVVGEVAATAAHKKLLDAETSHSVLFHAITTSTLSTDVAVANQRFGLNRIRFVGVPFTAANAYAMPDSWIWLVPSPTAAPGIPNSKDEVYDQRARACSAAQNAPGKCVVASMGHPNVKGAQVYANSIIASLAEFMNGWRAVHGPTQITAQ